MSEPITCLHLADLHFGVDNYGYANPATGLNTRLEDFSRSLEQAVDYAIERQVDLAVFAGDAYKRNSPSPTEQRELVKHILRLADTGIPCVLIAGNHDIPVMHGKASSIDIFRTLRPGMIHVCVNQPTFGENRPPVIETKHGPITVCCLPYISPSFLRNIPAYQNLKSDELVDRYEEFFNDVIFGMAESVPDEMPRILLAHLTAHGSMLGGYRGTSLVTDDVQIMPSNLAAAGYDYVALGHIHCHQNLSTKEEIPIVYPGSIDRVDFGEADEEKGFVIARIQRGGSEYEFVPIDVRPFADIRVEPDSSLELTDRILRAIEEEQIEGAVVRVRFEADDVEAQSLDMKRIHEALAPAHHKAGFIRIPPEAKTSRRGVSLTTDVTLADALGAYIREREDLKEDGEALLEKAKEIDRTVRKEL